MISNLIEGSVQKIIKMLTIPKIKQELEKLEKELDGNTDISSTISDIKRKYQELEEKLNWFCKERPNSPYCK